SKPPPQLQIQPAKEGEFQPPYAALEKQLKIKIKDDLLPLLESEIAVILPLNGLGITQPPTPVSDQPEPKPDTKDNAKEPPREEPQPTPSVAAAIALRDKEGMRALLPKIIETLA